MKEFWILFIIGILITGCKEKKENVSDFLFNLHYCSINFCQYNLLNNCQTNATSFQEYSKSCIEENTSSIEIYIEGPYSCDCFVDNKYHKVIGLDGIIPKSTQKNLELLNTWNNQKKEYLIHLDRVKKNIANQSSRLKKPVFKLNCEEITIEGLEKNAFWKNLIYGESIINSDLPVQSLRPKYSEIVFFKKNDIWLFKYGYISHSNISKITYEILNFIENNPYFFSDVTEIICPIFQPQE